MNISYKTVHVSLTPEIERYTEEKLASIEKLIAGNDSICEVILTHDEKHASGVTCRADFTVFSGKERVHAVGHGETILAAIDIAKDELANRLRREKKMHVRLLRKGGTMIKNMMRYGRSE